MTGPADAGAPRPLSDSDPNGAGPEGLAGGMGVSSERTGPVRGTPGEVTHGTEDTSKDGSADGDAAPYDETDDPGS